MQLEASTTLGSTFFGVPRKVTLLGGHPASFYRTILKEIPTPKGPDEEYDQMIEACIKWQPSRTQLLLYGDRVEENADRNSETILGIKLVLMKKLCKHAELRCLRMILSLLEATTDSVATTIETSLNQGKILYTILCLAHTQNKTKKQIVRVVYFPFPFFFSFL